MLLDNPLAALGDFRVQETKWPHLSSIQSAHMTCILADLAGAILEGSDITL